MSPEAYHDFTTRLLAWARDNNHIIGLVVLGSMADTNRADEWSDHDFWLVTVADYQEHYRAHWEWLPQSQDIVYGFRETAHGVKILYKSGHLLEYAVFDESELRLTRANAYRVLLDKSDIAIQMKQVADATNSLPTPSEQRLWGDLLTHLQVGCGRYARGETLSGHLFVKTYAVQDALHLFIRYTPAEAVMAIDSLDPWRRVHQVYPDLAAQIDALLRLDVPYAAWRLLNLVDQRLRDVASDYPIEAMAVIKAYILKAGAMATP